jgi:hypothetical protein
MLLAEASVNGDFITILNYAPAQIPVTDTRGAHALQVQKKRCKSLNL